MKINRRKFLSCLGACIGGGAVGAMLSPLPWKVMDDVAIWTQNWPWTPVPEDGPSTYVRSVCTLCPGGCGISVRKINNRAVRIEGLKNYPVNAGGLCPLGLSGLQYLYGPERVRSPLKRAGKRGEGKWQSISWDEGLAAITQQLVDLRAKGNPDSVAWISGSDKGTIPGMIDRFLTVYGSLNFIRASTARDTLEQVIYLTQQDQGAAVLDIENADFILSFGAGLLDGWGYPVRMANLFGNSVGEKTILQIEPRLSDTAAKAGQWISINPGTEGALALGIAHVIIRESLYNRNFIENFAIGFEDRVDDLGQTREGFKTQVMSRFPVEKVSLITGIPDTRIIDVARRFATARKPLAIGGRGQGRIAGSIQETMAIHYLNALMGNLNQTGGIGMAPESDYIQWPEFSMDETASNGIRQGRIDGAGSGKFSDTRYLLHRLPEIINSAAGDIPVRALLVSDANPLYTLPDTLAVKRAFDKIPFIVSFSPYMDETAEYADYILPDHTGFERFQDVPVQYAMEASVIGLSRPVVQPLYGTRHIGDTLIRLAKSMGGFIQSAFPWDSYESLLQETFGKSWTELKEKGFISVEHKLPAPGSYAFSTDSGKFEFCPAASETAQRGGFSTPVSFSPVPILGDVEQFPLVLIPYDTLRLANHHIANTPFMTKTVDDTVLKKTSGCIEINPLTAEYLRLAEGDEVILATPKGRALVKIHLYEGIMPGLIAFPRGLGHTAYSEEWCLMGKGVNFNSLIGPIDDPSSGLDTAWGIRARLDRA